MPAKEEEEETAQTANNNKDVELGDMIKAGGASKKYEYHPLSSPEEPYLELDEIVHLHADSNVDQRNIEASCGLTEEEAAKRLKLYGRNVLTPPPRTPEWKRFLLQFTNIFLILLNVCAILSFIAYILSEELINLYLAIVLVVVVFLTALLQFHEEGKAIQVVDSFAKMLASECRVIRGGKEKTIGTDQLVPGDVVKIKNGDRVPADIVLLLCRGLKTECSSLTGEAKPIPCNTQMSPKGTPYFECKNVAFNTSLCFDGMAIGLVFRTGDHTGIGTIAKLASDTKLRQSMLQIEVGSFVKFVAIIAISMATVVFVAAVFIQGAKEVDEVIALFVNGFLVIIVANVPQGLPATVTSLLSLAARNMAHRSVLVKRIDCVETLGSTSIICSDKTGTLTKNEMTVTDIWNDMRLKRRHKRDSDSLFGQGPQALFYRSSILCNGAGQQTAEESQRSIRDLKTKQLQRVQNASRLVWKGTVSQSVLDFEPPTYKFVGNPTDVALMNYADTLVSAEQLRQVYPIQFEVPFNSTNKYQVVVVQSVVSGIQEESTDMEYEVIMKGAPEAILHRCSTYASTAARMNHFQAEITDEFKAEFNRQYMAFASQGKRVIALCSKTFTAPPDYERRSAPNG